jgi:hypothetical protein
MSIPIEPNGIIPRPVDAPAGYSGEDRRIGTTDSCGFAPFRDGGFTSRDTASARVRARVPGTALAAERLGVR